MLKEPKLPSASQFSIHFPLLQLFKTIKIQEYIKEWLQKHGCVESFEKQIKSLRICEVSKQKTDPDKAWGTTGQ